MQGGGADCSNPLVRHQVDSMNEFLDKKLQQIIQGFNPIQVCHNYNADLGDFTYKIYVNVLQPSLAKPIFTSQDGSQTLMTPHLARMNNLTYAANLYVDVHVITDMINENGVTERKETTVPGVCIGKIPIMVRSKACVLTQMPSIGEGAGRNECRYDPGGYFIVGGNEKVIISQDRISENKTLVFAPNGNADGLNAEIRSMPDGVFLPPKTTSLHLSGKPNHMGRIIRLNTSFLRTEIPLFVMFRALGIETDREIIQHILLNAEDPKNYRMKGELMACAEDACDIHTQEDAFRVLLKVLGTTGTPREYLDQPERALNILKATISQDFLPHVGPSSRKKALYLGYMVRKMLRIHMGYDAFDNRDSYIHKRIDTPGVLFSNLFRQCYGKMIKEMRNLIVRELNLWRANPGVPLQIITPQNVHRFFKQSLLDTGLRYALSTGNWGVKTLGSFQNIRQGVAQVLNRMSYLSTLSHLRRINTPMEKNGKLVQPRKLENTQFGMICPSETPEGAAVGLVKNMALSTHITISMSNAHIREVIDELNVEQYHDEMTTDEAMQFLHMMGSEDAVHIIVNGDILGYTLYPTHVYQVLKHKKRTGVLPPTTAIIWDVHKGYIHINTEAGRMCRPVHIVDNGRELRLLNILANKGKTWAQYKDRKQFTHYIAPMEEDDEGFIEYMDVEEIDNTMLAMNMGDLQKGIKGTTLPPKYTHMELHPSLMNGVLAASIPFMDHNQSPRNCYQCLWEEEPVYMADGTWKTIKDVRIGDKVICFNPKTMVPSTTTVIHQYVRPAEKPIYKVVTASGRSIVATNDHKFMTSKGWTEIREFLPQTLVGVFPTPALASRQVVNDRVLVDTVGVIGVDTRLKSYGMLPLKAGSWQMEILARMIGYFKVHGMKLPKEPMDLHAMDDDAKFLGFTEYGIQDSGLYLLMKELGVDIRMRVPEWFAHVSAATRKEYVAGYLGAGGNLEFIRDVPGVTMEENHVRYHNAVAMQVALQKEYEKHVRAVDDWGLSKKYSWEEWRELVEVKGSSLFVPVAISERMRHVIISDITVESENHSFIGGGGFTVSNSAMGKQAVGVYTSNFNNRIDTMAHVLNYPQKPLVRTRLSKYTHSDQLASGMNAIVAIMTHTGFNQEDSIMVNKSALDRGLFTSTYYKSYRDQCSKNHSTGEEEIFVKPDSGTTAHMKPYNYGKLADDGFIPLNTAVDGNDVLIGKVMPHKIQGAIHPRDTSHVMKATDEGHVDMIYTGVNSDGYKFAKVRLRKYRKPMIGDKCACLRMDHEVLTITGWKFHKDLTLDDEVAVLKDGKLVYEKPEEIHYYPNFKGKMYHISNQTIDHDVTYNHRMWVSKRKYIMDNGKWKDIYLDYEFEFAENLVGKRVKYKKDAGWDVPEYQFVLPETRTKMMHFPEKTMNMDAWLVFFGIWIAEGWVGRDSYFVGIAANKQRVKDALKDVLPLLGQNYHIYGEKYCFSNAQICLYLRQFGKAVYKYIPEWAFKLSRRQTQLLLHGLMLGDGHHGKSGTSREYYTSSKRLADDVQRLCLHAGYAGDIYFRYPAGRTSTTSDGRTIKTIEDSWQVRIHYTRVHPTVNHGHVHEQKIQKEYMYDFEGPVFCLTVSSGVFMVRKNGKQIWTGNSRSAQKGTIGMIYNHQDMPFAKTGIVPDIIMNPHAIPSRMTIGQLMECIMGKACCHIGSLGDATPFTDCSVESIASVLEKSGMERYGNEILYNGRTGEMIKTEIFIGPTYYQRLKHMVADKAHVRGSNGPVVMMTRQPAEGRARNGGLRFGEMERDAIVAHGASAFLKERMQDTSDNYRVFVCRKCGLLCTANPEKNIYKCSNCKNNADITQVRIPYSMKLLIQELMTMSVAPRMVV